MAKTCIFLADGFEEIEGLMVVDLLRRAQISIEMVSISDKLMINGAHEIKVMADKTFDEMSFESIDMLILPGGMPGTRNLSNHKGLIELLEKFHKENKKISAICAAPSILGTNKILQGKKATCFPGFEEQLEGAVYVNEKVVKDGNIITSKGLGTALEFALEIIKELKGEELSIKIKEMVQY